MVPAINPQTRLLFHELADLPHDERERVLAERRIAPELRAELESLWSFDSVDRGHLTGCVSGVAEELLQSVPAVQDCGPYRLVRLLGRGGMGAVYLGERKDGEIQKTVAIKLLSGEGDRPGWRDRFLRERQLLASLNHPSIVHVIDAGRTGDSRPYLVMEYVAGVSIDLHASTMDLRERLMLFLRVCEGVSHAHRHLIIHRDLKPSNILVDASGQPKLLDFGIARILDDTGDQTRTVERLLTPNYASPEQLRGDSQTTATDVYSLGAVLYKILTGRSPHESETHTSQVAEVIAGTREIPAPSSLNRELPRDLDYILRKALRMEPEKRYSSVDTFANDIRAFLGSRPIEARSGNTWYRTGKFLRRYWVPVVAAMLVIASLSAGLYIANRQRLIAERRFAQLRQLSHQVLFDLEGDLKGLPGALTARIKVVSMSTRYLEGLGLEARRDRELALEVGDAYLQVARIQGVPAWNNLGQYVEAEESLRKADMFIESVLAVDPHNRKALWLAANAAHDGASLAYTLRRQKQVLDTSRKVVERFDRLARLGNLTWKEINGATYMYADVAEEHIGMHRFQDAAGYARLGIEISRTNPTVSGPRAQAFSQLASALMNLGDLVGAQDAIRQAREQCVKLWHDEGDTRYTRAIFGLVRLEEGLILGEEGGVNLNRPSEAAVVLGQAIEALEQSAKSEPKDHHSRIALTEPGRSLGNILRHDNPRQALEVYDHSLMRIREVPDDVKARRAEASLLACSSYAARSIHREDDAKGRIDTAFRLLREAKDFPAEAIKPGSEAGITLRALADHFAETSQLEKAVEAYQDLRRKMVASSPDPLNDLPNATYISSVDASLAGLLRRVGRAGEAVNLDTDRLALWRHWDRKLPTNAFVQRQIETVTSLNLPHRQISR